MDRPSLSSDVDVLLVRLLMLNLELNLVLQLPKDLVCVERQPCNIIWKSGIGGNIGWRYKCRAIARA